MYLMIPLDYSGVDGYDVVKSDIKYTFVKIDKNSHRYYKQMGSVRHKEDSEDVYHEWMGVIPEDLCQCSSESWLSWHCRHTFKGSNSDLHKLRQYF